MSRPSFWRFLFTAVVGIVAVLGAGEWVVRTWVESPSIAIPTPRLRWRYGPHVRIVHSGEGFSIQRTNALGLLSPELLSPRTGRRVIVLGDSYAEALQVPAGQGFAAVAGRALPGTEVVNAGTSGYSPLDCEEWAAMHAPALAPDVLVLELSEVNVRELLLPGVPGRIAHPPSDADRDAAEPETRMRRLARSIMQHSALATLGVRRVTLLVADQRARLSRRFREAAVVAARTGAPPADPRLPALLDTVCTRASRLAPRFVILYIPHIEYFKPGQPLTDSAASAVVHEVATRHGWPLVDAGPGFREEFRRTGQPVHGFDNSVKGSGHINEAGHRIVGAALARELRGEKP